jgi:hypothetical protein
MEARLFDGAQFGKDVVAAVNQHVADVTRPLKEQIAELKREVVELKREIVELKTRGSFKGAYQSAQSYQLGNSVQQDGHMWIAIEDVAVNVKSGESDAWALAVRRGRDSHERERGPHDAR